MWKKVFSPLKFFCHIKTKKSLQTCLRKEKKQVLKSQIFPSPEKKKQTNPKMPLFHIYFFSSEIKFDTVDWSYIFFHSF